jgi:phosphatidylserine decarboxylase
LSKEGFGIIFFVFIFALLFGILALQHHSKLLGLLFWMDVIVLGLMFYFFRDPQRFPPINPKAIVSPADGHVIAIEVTKEPIFVNDMVNKVSIFLSVLDVHVNYVPFDGKVEYVRFNRGDYHPAGKPEASEKNAHTFIGIQTKYGRMAVKQAAGILARRIVCYLREGDKVERGQKLGIIKFGSRMEVFLPSWAQVTVKVGDKLYAGESVIGTVNEK